MARLFHPPSVIMGMVVVVLAAATWFLPGEREAWAEVRNPHGVAVIIGNQVYRNKDIPPVDYAHRDAEAFKRYVVEVLGYDPANVIHLKDATRAQMQNVLGHRTAPMNDIQAWLNMLDAEGGSEVIVYYSGHGVPAEKGTPSLLPVDVAPHAARTEGYPIELLYEKLGQLQGAKSVRVFLDTCFSGSSDGGRLVAGSPVYMVARLPEAVGERMTVLTAVTKTQIATWDKKARHGLFTHHLLDALYGRGDQNKDGKVTAAEVKGYLDRRMTSAAWISNRRVQQATLRGMADVVLAEATDGNTFASRPVLETSEGRPESGAATGGTGEAKGKGEGTAETGGAAGRRVPPGVSALKASDHESVEEALGLDRAARVLIQRGLAELGLAVGYADGLFGKKTRGAIREWQAAKRLEATGYLTKEQAEALKALGEGVARAEKEKVGRERKAREVAERERLVREAAEAERAARELAERERLRPGREFRDCEGCPEMVVVPAGEYMMGSPRGEAGRGSDEGPQHRVRIGAAFGVGKYEVTFEEWDACVSDGGCGGHRPTGRGWGRGRRPVNDVSWEDAKMYVEWLSRKTGKRYRLLSEAEWEYVARAGTTTSRYWGDSEGVQCKHANGAGRERTWDVQNAACRDGHEWTAPVGSYSANGFGVYDVLGNVSEWVEDCRHGDYTGAPDDGKAWVSGGNCGRRVVRGGSLVDEPRNLRSADRFWSSTGTRYYFYGFRIARTLTP